MLLVFNKRINLDISELTAIIEKLNVNIFYIVQDETPFKNIKLFRVQECSE